MPFFANAAWYARSTSSRIFSPLSVTIALRPYFAISSMVLPLAIGM